MKLALLILSVVALSVSAQPQIVSSFEAPASGVSGLSWAQNSLWAVTTTGTVYEIDPGDGSVLSSFSVTCANPNGLGYGGSLLYITNGSYYVYKYTLGGTYQGACTLYCPG